MGGRARFITLEGGEGVGKSTLVTRLTRWLIEDQKIDLVQTREPGGTLVADQIRGLFKVPPSEEVMTARTEALLVSAARAQHIDVLIKPSLASGKWVICDRFTDSTRVYQGLLGGVAMNELERLIAFSTDGLNPDLTLLLDCDVKTSMARIRSAAESSGRDNAARFDHASEAIHQRLRDSYRRVAGFFPSRFFIVDASQDSEKVFSDVKSYVAEKIKSWT